MNITNISIIFASCLLSISSLNAQQQYPNVDGETLLEDERVVVQRFVLEPGQWEGIHEHPEHQLVIVLNRSEEVIYRFGDTDNIITVDESEINKLQTFWRPGPVTLDERHESKNNGTQTMEWIAITFKSDSISTENKSTSRVPGTND